MPIIAGLGGIGGRIGTRGVHISQRRAEQFSCSTRMARPGSAVKLGANDRHQLAGFHPDHGHPLQRPPGSRHCRDQLGWCSRDLREHRRPTSALHVRNRDRIGSEGFTRVLAVDVQAPYHQTYVLRRSRPMDASTWSPPAATGHSTCTQSEGDPTRQASSPILRKPLITPNYNHYFDSGWQIGGGSQAFTLFKAGAPRGRTLTREGAGRPVPGWTGCHWGTWV